MTDAHEQGPTAAAESALTRGTYFLARRLELVAIAILLRLLWPGAVRLGCGGIFFVFF